MGQRWPKRRARPSAQASGQPKKTNTVDQPEQAEPEKQVPPKPEGRAVGPPCDPIPFPQPKLSPGVRILAPVHVPDDADPLSQALQSGGARPSTNDDEAVPPPPSDSSLRRADSMAGNVLVPISSDGKPPERAYWIQRKVAKTAYGSTRVGYILRPLASNPDEDDEEETEEQEQEPQAPKEGESKSTFSSPNEVAQASSMFWEVMCCSPQNGKCNYDMVTVNIYERSKVMALKGKRMGDPIAELAAQQIVSTTKSSHIQRRVEGTIEALEDDKFIYGVVPHGVDGDLLKYVEASGGRLEEGVARHFFKQILEGLGLMHSVGICHRDLSLENVFMRGVDCYIIPGIMSLKVPFTSGTEDKPATDHSDCVVRRLMTPQGQCGKSGYVPPEVLSNEAPFDGFAVDLWAASISLFHMLFGHPPFVWATEDDPTFQLVAVRGELQSFAQKWMEKSDNEASSESRTISDAAITLLQKCLMADPSDRLTLEEVMDDPWIKDGEDIVPQTIPSVLGEMVGC